MAEPIKNGADGTLAKVDGTNRLWTRSVTINEETEANDNGTAYNVNTGTINLSDAVETPLLYFKNNELEDFHITALAVGLGPTTGGSGGVPVITVVRNPTAGTIISSAVNVDIFSNRNFGSSKTLLNSPAYKGATGDTLTDGGDHLLFYQSAGGRLFATVDEILPSGASIGVKLTPQAGNTSMDVYCALISHLESENNGG